VYLVDSSVKTVGTSGLAGSIKPDDYVIDSYTSDLYVYESPLYESGPGLRYITTLGQQSVVYLYSSKNEDGTYQTIDEVFSNQGIVPNPYTLYILMKDSSSSEFYINMQFDNNKDDASGHPVTEYRWMDPYGCDLMTGYGYVDWTDPYGPERENGDNYYSNQFGYCRFNEGYSALLDVSTDDYSDFGPSSYTIDLRFLQQRWDYIRENQLIVPLVTMFGDTSDDYSTYQTERLQTYFCFSDAWTGETAEDEKPYPMIGITVDNRFSYTLDASMLVSDAVWETYQTTGVWPSDLLCRLIIVYDNTDHTVRSYLLNNKEEVVTSIVGQFTPYYRHDTALESLSHVQIGHRNDYMNSSNWFNSMYNNYLPLEVDYFTVKLENAYPNGVNGDFPSLPLPV
jgi:hypothetical protein